MGNCLKRFSEVRCCTGTLDAETVELSTDCCFNPKYDLETVYLMK
jgi:hypothetical protein